MLQIRALSLEPKFDLIRAIATALTFHKSSILAFHEIGIGFS